MSELTALEEIPLHEPDRTRLFTRPVQIATLITAMLAGIIAVLDRFTPGGPWLWLGLCIFLAALEGILTTDWLSHPDRRTLERGWYRLAEAIVIILLLRLLTWAIFRSWPDPANVRDYLLNPWLVLDGIFILFVVLTLIAWSRGIGIGSLLSQVRLSKVEADYYRRAAGYESQIGADRPIFVNRLRYVSLLQQRWVGGGLLLALCAALSSIDLAGLTDGSTTSLRSIGRLGLHPLMLAALLVYFLLGLWLISQARFEAMHTRWTTEGVRTAWPVKRAWRRQSLALLLIVAGLATLLPIGSTIALARIVQFIILATFFVFNVIVGVFLFLLGLLFSLFGGNNAPLEDTPPLPPPRLPTPPPAEVGPVSETPALVVGAFFWLTLLVVGVLALVFFLRGRGYPLRLATARAMAADLWHWLRALWRRAEETVELAGLALRERLNRAGDGQARRSWRFVNARPLSPREQVRLYYLQTIRLAGRQGVARPQAGTPLEFANTLREAWPEGAADVDALTDDFQRARYTDRPIDDDAVAPARQRWQRLRKLFNQPRPNDDEESTAAP